MGEVGSDHFHGTNTVADKVRILISLFLVCFSVALVLKNILLENTKFAAEIHPAAAAIILYVLIAWMTMVEGGQCSMVGLPPIDRELYRESHPITYKITGWGHAGDNLDRYLMGRQFMVIFMNFTIGLCGAPLDPTIPIWGLPTWVITIFVGSGIGMVLQNVIIGQLTSQVNASHCMLDYINTHFMTFTYWVAAGIEVTGVVHMSYLIRMMAYWAAGKPVESNEPPKVGAVGLFYYGRIAFSTACVCFGLAVTIDALFKGQTSSWDGVPEIISLILFFLFMCCVGLLEGMQIAFFTVAKLPKSERGTSPMALRTCECLFKNGGKNLPGFMCGRQMTVTLCFFVIARVTTITTQVGGPDGDDRSYNIFNVSNWVQEMFNLGFMGALVTTVLGSIAWQLVAGAFPIAFLSNPVVFIFLQTALFIEATGICSAAWFFGMLQRKAMGFQFDEVYVGTPEERAAKGHADTVTNLTAGTFLPATAVGTQDLKERFKPLSTMQATYSNRRTKLLGNIKELRIQIEAAEFDEERECYQHALTLEIQCLGHMNDDENAAKDSDEGNKIGDEDMGADDSDDDV